MPLTNQQRLDILDYLGRSQNWTNLFDIDFFADEKRRWKRMVSEGALHVDLSPDRTQAYVIHEDTGAVLSIKKRGHRLLVEDESGRKQGFVQNTALRENSDDVRVSEFQSAAAYQDTEDGTLRVDLEAMGLILHFHSDGSKTVFLENDSRQVHFDPPVSVMEQKNHPGRFLHAITFNEAAAEDWGLSLVDLLLATKLVVAIDLQIEPGLKAVNVMDERKVAELMRRAETPEKDYSVHVDHERWRPNVEKHLTKSDVRALEKPWTDVTDYEGFQIALPVQFAIARTEEGFDLKTQLDHREKILSVGRMLRHAKDNDAQPVSTFAKKVTAGSLLHMFESGVQTKDHRGRSWNYVVFESQQANAVSSVVRDICSRNFDLHAYHYAVVSHQDDACFFAIDARKLKEIRCAYSASLELKQMIEKNSQDVKRMVMLLDDGADLRLIDDLAATDHRTFATLMHAARNTTLLQALRDHRGGRSDEDLAFVLPAAPDSFDSNGPKL